MRRACLLLLCATVVAAGLAFVHGPSTTTADAHGSDALSALVRDAGGTPSLLAVTVAVVVIAALARRQRATRPARGTTRRGRTASTCERAPPGAARSFA